ncbi:MAG TPA: Rossmann-like and DUF2520 domain-containing protein [Ktedonobacterales bacterium]|nr:Rossmann-like and DUF2520 domain-containing protein [Ktedonobacterales bacterium]
MEGAFDRGANPGGRIGIIGAGAVGSALAVALAARGARVIAVCARQRQHAERLAERIPSCHARKTPAEVARASDLVFVATPDDAIASIAVLPIWRAGQGVVHLSGAVGVERLAGARQRGAWTAALHPLMTFPARLRDASVEDILAWLAGVTWALEAPDATLAETLRQLVATLDGRTITLTAADRAPYHLAAVLASNYVVGLLGAAVALWEGFGVAPEDTLMALLPLVRASVENLAQVGLPAALTGPLARGDLSTIAAHLAWLRTHTLPAEQAPGMGTTPQPDTVSGSETSDDTTRRETLAALNEAYIALARLTIPLAQAKGTLSDEMAQKIRAALTLQAVYAALNRPRPTEAVK